MAHARRGALRSVPIVGLTSSESDSEARRLRDGGFAQCLVKPIRTDALVPLLAGLAGRRAGRRWDDRR